MEQAKAVVDEYLLRDMLDDATVSKLLDAFGRVCNVGAGIFTPSTVRIGKGGHHSPFCTLVRSTQEGRDRCAECDKRKAESCRENPYADKSPYDCHAGLIDFCVPISASVKGKHPLIGLFFAGQVLYDDEQRPTATDVASLHKLASECRLEFNELLAHYMQVPRLPRARITEIRTLMKSFADLIGELVQRKAAAQELLLDVINHSNDGEAVVKAIGRHLEPSAVSIFLEGKSLNLQPEDRVFLAATTYEGLPAKELSSVLKDKPMEYSYGRNEGFTGWVYATGQILYVPDCWNEDRYPDQPHKPTWLHKVHEVPQWECTQAFLGVPVRDSNGRTVGVIRAVRLKGDRLDNYEPFSEDERELLKGVAVLVGAAFQRAQESREHAENQARAAQARDVKLINDMMMRVALAESYSQAARVILGAAMQMVPCACLGYIVSSGGGGSGTDLRVEATGPESVKLDTDFMTREYGNGRGVVCHVVATGKSFCGNVPDGAQERGICYVPCNDDIRSELTVPIKQPARAVPEGAINLESTIPDAFRQEDLERLEMLAYYAGVTVHNAVLTQLSRNIISSGRAWFDQAAQKLESLLEKGESA